MRWKHQHQAPAKKPKALHATRKIPIIITNKKMNIVIK
jgi:hypothetical protein